MPDTTRPPEQLGSADKLAAVINTAVQAGLVLGSLCRERPVCTPSRLAAGARPLRMRIALTCAARRLNVVELIVICLRTLKSWQ